VTILAARLAGARTIAVSDVLDHPLEQAKVVGADVALHAQRDAQSLAKPQFDVVYEVSGSFAALKTCMAAVKRGGVVVQVGTLPHEPLPFVVNDVMAKEIDLRGAFRWGIEFDWAVDYLSSRRVDVRPLLSGQYPLEDAVQAFHAAADKNRATKVQVVA
jgi:L-idonate 5-dehydrogenase